MTSYLIQGASILGGEPTDFLIARRRHLDQRDRRLPATSRSSTRPG